MAYIQNPSQLITNAGLGLFEKPSTLGPVSPRGALGACTEELDDRFRGLDTSVREPLLRDMQAEDAVLEHYVEKCRLEKWFEGAMDLAKRDVQQEANEETEDGEVMKEVAQQLKAIEEKISSDGMKTAVSMLRSKPRFKPKTKLNGSVAAFRGSFIR